MTDLDSLSIGQVAKYLGKSTSTLRNWTDEFSEFLSPEAVAGDGRTRVYRESDVAVLKLVNDMRDKRLEADEIFIALRNGERGLVNDLEAISLTVELSETEPQVLALRLQFAQRELERAMMELEEARGIIESTRGLREENIRLQTQIEATQDQLGKVSQIYLAELKKKEDQLEKFMEQAAEGRVAQKEIERMRERVADLEKTISAWQQYFQGLQHRRDGENQ